MTALENGARRFARTVGLLGVAALLTTCTGSTGPPRPSVILISIDTLRADRLRSYGATTNETPTLDAVAKQGIVYERAYSPSSWTLPSHRSMLTGLYPAEVNKDSPSIAEIFRARGYTTAAFTGGGVMSEKWGFARGFDTFYAYEHPPSAPSDLCPPGRFDGAEVFKRARAWLHDSSRQPFFLFIHTYEVHDRCQFLTRDVSTRPLPDPGPSGRKEVSDYYATLIARLDHLLGALLDDLDARGGAANTVVVITSDHGESLWEHGRFGHGCQLKPYEELVHVPLILRYPARFQKPGRIAQPVSNIAALPTVLELAGLPLEPTMHGRVLPGLGLDEKAPPAPVFSDCGKTLAVWMDRYKLIRVRGGGVEDELYDLEVDPHEKENLAGRDLPWGTQLRRFAADYSGASPPRDETPVFDQTKQVFDGLDEKTRERLRALGYLRDDEH